MPTDFEFEASHGAKASVTKNPKECIITVHGVCKSEDCGPCASIIVQAHNWAAFHNWEVVYHNFSKSEDCPCSDKYCSVRTECVNCTKSTIDLHTLPIKGIGNLVFTTFEPSAILCDPSDSPSVDGESPFVVENGWLYWMDFNPNKLHPDYWISLIQYFIDIGYSSEAKKYDDCLEWFLAEYFEHLVETGQYYSDENPWIHIIRKDIWDCFPKYQSLRYIETWDKYNIDDFTVN